MMNSPVKYGTRFGCRWGMPHDLIKIGENKHQTWERCSLCNKTFRWNKGYKGRIENTEYLKAHVRQYAQDFGTTKRVYKKLYSQKEIIINL